MDPDIDIVIKRDGSKPHNNSITKMEMSPNKKFLVTYSEKDGKGCE